MSYDLYFYFNDKTRQISFDDFRQYFNGHSNYEIKDKSAVYQNENTGVYFNFEYNGQPSEEEPENEISLTPVHFNLNYFRPYIFALEADKELTNFIDHFHLSVNDPQVGGMGNSGYSTEGFLNDWNKGNEIAFGHLIRQQTETPYSLPAKDIERYWRWNYNIKKFYDELNLNIFVPRIVF